MNEIVLFRPFIERGLVVSTSDFFRGLLYYWGIQLHHLTTNSILHISIFTLLREAFLGVEPHFDLFRHLFYVRPKPSSNKIFEIGGAKVLLRPGVEDHYIFYTPASQAVDWKSSWFYVGNHQPSLPD